MTVLNISIFPSYTKSMNENQSFTDVKRKMEEIFVASQYVQDLVMEFGALAAQMTPEPVPSVSDTEESTPTGATS